MTTQPKFRPNVNSRGENEPDSEEENLRLLRRTQALENEKEELMFQLETQKEDNRAAIAIGIIAAAIIALGLFGSSISPAAAGEQPSFSELCDKFLSDCPTDTNTTKNFNDRFSDFAVLSAAADSRIANGSKDLNIDFNAITGGDNAGFGGAAFVNLNKFIGHEVHVGPRGAVNTEGDFVVGIGASVALDIF